MIRADEGIGPYGLLEKFVGVDPQIDPKLDIE